MEQRGRDDLKRLFGWVVRCRSQEGLADAARDVRLKSLVDEMPEFGQDVLGTRVVWELHQRPSQALRKTNAYIKSLHHPQNT